MTTLVKTLLVLALLAPVAALAQSSDSGWTVDTRTGCRVVNANPQPNESVSWSGGCVNGFAQGSGVLQWYENGQPGERYQGDMRGGEMNGHGTLNAANGGHYVGEFRAGKADGMGEWTTASGTFSGLWRAGCFNDGKRRAWVGTDASSCR